MPVRSLKARRVASVLDNKLPGKARSGSENNKWVEIDGKKVARVTYPMGHSGDLTPGTANSIRNQMLLTQAQFYEFIGCRLTQSNYEQLLRSMQEEDLV
jgi:hypothetical protein